MQKLKLCLSMLSPTSPSQWGRDGALLRDLAAKGCLYVWAYLVVLMNQSAYMSSYHEKKTKIALISLLMQQCITGSWKAVHLSHIHVKVIPYSLVLVIGIVLVWETAEARTRTESKHIQYWQVYNGNRLSFVSSEASRAWLCVDAPNVIQCSQHYK